MKRAYGCSSLYSSTYLGIVWTIVQASALRIANIRYEVLFNDQKTDNIYMSDSKDIEIFEDNTENIISKTLTSMVEGLTGIATSSTNDKILSVSHIFNECGGASFYPRLQKNGINTEQKVKLKMTMSFPNNIMFAFRNCWNFWIKTHLTKLDLKY